MSVDITSLIESARTRADSTAQAAQNVAASALNNFFVPGGTAYKVPMPSLRGTPPAYTGNMNIVADLKQAFSDAFGDFKPEMEEALADYIGRFFPECVRSSTDNWICNTILYGGTGVPANIQDAIWERARRAEIMEAKRVESEAISAFASRGFTMPGGYVASQVMAAQQEAANKSSTIGRDIAIKNVELEIENIKFAIQQGVALRVGVLGALGSYIRAYMSPIELAMEKAKVLADAQQRLWSSTADYYRAMVSEAQLAVSVHEINARSHDSLQNNQNASLQRSIESRVSAAVSVAQVLGQLAAGASAATVSLAGEEALTIRSGE